VADDTAAPRRLTKDEYFLRMLELVAARGTCPRRQVGAIIANGAGQVISTGYNGPPRGHDHCIDVPCPGVEQRSGDSSRCEAVHAEQNAILQAGGRLIEAYTLYVSCTPCFTCAKMIANTPIRRIVVLEPYADPRGEAILTRSGIELIVIHG
jgi:dCMP deaminase